MAELRVDAEFLRSLLLGDLRARIVGVRFDGVHTVYLELEGEDVPDCSEVLAVVTERARTVRLEPGGW